MPSACGILWADGVVRMSAALVALYAPYCQGDQLETGLQWLARGELLGRRQLRPAGERPFVLRWQPGVAPLETTRAQLEVMADGVEQPVRYSFELPTHQLLSWLIGWLAAGGGSAQPADLPESFWQWLILGLETTAPQP
jgi:hypothetical protein